MAPQLIDRLVSATAGIIGDECELKCVSFDAKTKTFVATDAMLQKFTIPLNEVSGYDSKNAQDRLEANAFVKSEWKRRGILFDHKINDNSDADSGSGDDDDDYDNDDGDDDGDNGDDVGDSTNQILHELVSKVNKREELACAVVAIVLAAAITNAAWG